MSKYIYIGVKKHIFRATFKSSLSIITRLEAIDHVWKRHVLYDGVISRKDVLPRSRLSKEKLREKKRKKLHGQEKGGEEIVAPRPRQLPPTILMWNVFAILNYLGFCLLMFTPSGLQYRVNPVGQFQRIALLKRTPIIASAEKDETWCF